MSSRSLCTSGGERSAKAVYSVINAFLKLRTEYKRSSVLGNGKDLCQGGHYCVRRLGKEIGSWEGSVEEVISQLRHESDKELSRRGGS